MIRVVAACTLGSVEVDTPVVVRTIRSIDQFSERFDVQASYDSLLDSFNLHSVNTISDDLNRRGAHQDITYVIPGYGIPGDMTVDLIDPELLGEVVAAATHRSGVGARACMVVDALELAHSQLQVPFHRGLVALEPTVPLVVTNWYGTDVTSLASRLLHGVYPDSKLPEPTSEFELHIPAGERPGAKASMAELEHIVARLRRPDGCPWDRDQTRASLYPQFVAELEELGQAIESDDVPNQREELGDVLFHIVAQCQLAAEAGDFSFDDVLRGITAKLVRRHPHVFGDAVAETYEDVLSTWQRVKAEEKSSGQADQ